MKVSFDINPDPHFTQTDESFIALQGQSLVDRQALVKLESVLNEKRVEYRSRFSGNHPFGLIEIILP